MTEFDQQIRDADPYRPGVADRLDGAGQDLLEEIMSTPPSRRSSTWRLIGAAAAAVALAGVAGVTVAQQHGGAEPVAGPPAATAPASGSPTTMELVLKAVESNPRLLIDEPGWKVTTVYGFAQAEGTVNFRKGERDVEINWYPAGQYDGFHEDRLKVSAPEPVRVTGWPGDLFRYSATDFAVMLRPRDGAFAEFRTSANWTRGDFDALLAKVKQVDARTWMAALPPEIVTPDKVDEAAGKVLAGVPLPPGFDSSSIDIAGANDPYQFGAAVTGKVGCAWIAEWERADRVRDRAARDRAVAAMRSSHDWKVLHDMNAAGDWPEVFWQIADAMAAGESPTSYRSGIGCD